MGDRRGLGRGWGPATDGGVVTCGGVVLERGRRSTPKNINAATGGAEIPRNPVFVASKTGASFGAGRAKAKDGDREHEVSFHDCLV